MGEVKIKIQTRGNLSGRLKVDRIIGEYIGECQGIKLVVHKSKNTGKLFVVTEALSGLAISSGLTKNFAIKNAQRLIKRNKEKLVNYLKMYKEDKQAFLNSGKVRVKIKE